MSATRVKDAPAHACTKCPLSMVKQPSSHAKDGQLIARPTCQIQGRLREDGSLVRVTTTRASWEGTGQEDLARFFTGLTSQHKIILCV
jgi:hypothetical protein